MSYQVRIGSSSGYRVRNIQGYASINGITILDEGVVVGTPGLVNSINFVGDGITATATGAASTIIVDNASTTTKGVAAFNPLFFTVNAGIVSITSNAIGLGTHTYGRYARTIVGGNGLSATAINPDDGTDYTINVNPGAGISITSDAVAFKNAAALSNNNLLKWDSTNTQLVSSIINDNGTTASVAGDLSVTGSFYVAGSTTQINTTTLQIEDRVIEIGKVQGTPPPNTTWDLGILFNYYTSNTNKKASVYWEHGSQRFLFASDVTESVLGINLPDSGPIGLGTTTPQLSSPVFAPIEVGQLWVNDVAGSNAVISYLPLNGLYNGSPAGRYLQNVIVDGGTY